MSQSIIIKNGISKRVKNLGYLLKHCYDVKQFRVYTKNLTNKNDDAYLVAEFYNGNKYETGFASFEVLKSFLKRPVFYNLTVIIDGIETLIVKLAR